ncbi:astacin-like metalloprotease toxin 5 [Centruroides sculpturatus]|uniref:astacin-like metalloprotease toxin 5 n=1 Tax=Centruroides sculpturatus TaxID=218467 RepID=UPI000C6CCF51|nr:astacin-like metalloprotease toxin 5 [Centruroides sculpturatus]
MHLLIIIYSLTVLIVNAYFDLGDIPMQNPDLFQGDIILFDDDDERNAVVGKNRVWPNGIIPYTIDAALESARSRIEAVMKDYEELTSGCIKFRPKEDQNAYVRVFKGVGCYSHIGKTLGSQPLSLGPGCLSYGHIAHELGHSIGFEHEHSRSDRDDHITIFWENIQKGMEDQFKKLSPSKNLLFNEFDYDSIMLYGEYIFSIDHSEKKTMVAKKEGVRLKDVKEKTISKSDVYRIRKLYKCE